MSLVCSHSFISSDNAREETLARPQMEDGLRAPGGFGLPSLEESSLVFPMWREKMIALLMAGASQRAEGKEEVAGDGGKTRK